MIDRRLPPANVILRSARISDAARLAEIAAACYRDAFSNILEPRSLAACDQGYFMPRFQREWKLVRLAEAEGAVIGFSMVTRAHLDMLFVSQRHAGHGLGTVLLVGAEARGAKTLETFRDNHAARRFYERHGWSLKRSYEREFLGHDHAFVWYAKS